jgi:hypothetical protein
VRRGNGSASHRAAQQARLQARLETLMPLQRISCSSVRAAISCPAAYQNAFVDDRCTLLPLHAQAPPLMRHQSGMGCPNMSVDRACALRRQRGARRLSRRCFAQARSRSGAEAATATTSTTCGRLQQGNTCASRVGPLRLQRPPLTHLGVPEHMMTQRESAWPACTLLCPGLREAFARCSDDHILSRLLAWIIWMKM